MEAMKVQAQIRANAEEMQDYLRDLNRWEKDMTRKDKTIKKKSVDLAQGRVPVRSSGGMVSVTSSAESSSKTTPSGSSRKATSSAAAALPKKAASSGEGGGKDGEKGQTAAGHTYDEGYSKWEKFDVDAALKEADEEEGEERPEQDDDEEEEEEENDDPQPDGSGSNAVPLITPATITKEAERFKVDPAKVAKPRPRGELDVNPEMREREKGNDHYRRGEFAQSIRCYTRCIGYNSKSVLAFSNRAMTYLKLKEFRSAAQDATIALDLDPTHVKSLQRRASARSCLGMHRAALQDLDKALQLKPSRELHVEARKAREMLRASIRRVVPVRVPLQVVATVPNMPSRSPPPTPSLASVSVPLPPASSLCTEITKTTTAAQFLAKEEEDVEAGLVEKEAVTEEIKGQSSSTGTIKHQVVASNSSIIMRPAPRNGYDLYTNLRVHGSDNQAKAKYLQTKVPMSGLSRLLALSFEPDLLTEMLFAIEAMAKEEVEEDKQNSSSESAGGGGGRRRRGAALEWLGALIKLPRFEMAAMLLSRESQEMVGRIMQKMMMRKETILEEKEASELRRKFGL